MVIEEKIKEEKIMKMPLPILRWICCSRPAAGAGWGVKVETQSWKVLCKYTYVCSLSVKKWQRRTVAADRGRSA